MDFNHFSFLLKKCTNSKTNVLSNFYVKDGQICEFYGWKGKDIYSLNKKTTLAYFKDFKANKDDDFIFIKRGYSDIQAKEKEKKKAVLFARYKNGWKYVVLEGVSESDVKKWLEIAKHPENYSDKINKNNPIKIK